MQRARIGAAFALFLFVSSALPAFAVDRQVRGPDENGPIDRIVHLIRNIVKPIVHILDQPIIPKP